MANKPLDLLFKLLIYEGNETNDPADADKVYNRTQEETVSKFQRERGIIADADSKDYTPCLPDATVDYVVILTDRELTLTINGSATDITVSPRANGTKTIVYLQRGALTGLVAANASGADANVDMVFVKV